MRALLVLFFLSSLVAIGADNSLTIKTLWPVFSLLDCTTGCQDTQSCIFSTWNSTLFTCALYRTGWATSKYASCSTGRRWAVVDNGLVGLKVPRERPRVCCNPFLQLHSVWIHRDWQLPMFLSSIYFSFNHHYSTAMPYTTGFTLYFILFLSLDNVCISISP